MSKLVFTKVAEAYDRKKFMAAVDGKINGAIVEFYKARLAEKHGFQRWVLHWKNEAKRLLEHELPIVIDRATTFKNKRLAIEAAIVNLKKRDGSFREEARNTIKKDFI